MGRYSNSSNKQLSTSFTKFPNMLLNGLISAQFNATQIKVILCVIRYTFGFHRDSHLFSLSFLEKATGTSKRYLSDQVNKLIKMNVLIEVAKYNQSKAREMKVNLSSILLKVELNNCSTGSCSSEPHRDDDLAQKGIDDYINQEIKAKKKKELNTFPIKLPTKGMLVILSKVDALKNRLTYDENE